MFSPWTDRHGEFQIIPSAATLPGGGGKKKKKKSHGSFPANQNPIHLNANVNFKGDKTKLSPVAARRKEAFFFSSSSLFRNQKGKNGIK